MSKAMTDQDRRSKAVLVKVRPDELERIRKEVNDTGVPFARMVRRALPRLFQHGNPPPA